MATIPVTVAQAARILSDDELNEVLSVENLDLPERPEVVDIKVEDYQDSTGEEALDVYVILNEATQDGERTWQALKPVYEAIREKLRAAGDSRFPYITAGTPIEYARRYSYDPATDE